MKNICNLWIFSIVIMLSACTPNVEVIDLSTVPDIPEDMIHEQKGLIQ